MTDMKAYWSESKEELENLKMNYICFKILLDAILRKMIR